MSTASNVLPFGYAGQRSFARGEPFGVLDIGTSKMCCLIARHRNGHGLELLGAGLHAPKVEEVVDQPEHVVAGGGDPRHAGR